MTNYPTTADSCCGTASATGAITTAHAADPIKIGVVTPLSGTYAGIGQQVKDGASNPPPRRSTPPAA